MAAPSWSSIGPCGFSNKKIGFIRKHFEHRFEWAIALIPTVEREKIAVVAVGQLYKGASLKYDIKTNIL
jgi:hypothetical protein